MQRVPPSDGGYRFLCVALLCTTTKSIAHVSAGDHRPDPMTTPAGVESFQKFISAAMDWKFKGEIVLTSGRGGTFVKRVGVPVITLDIVLYFERPFSVLLARARIADLDIAG